MPAGFEPERGWRQLSDAEGVGGAEAVTGTGDDRGAKQLDNRKESNEVTFQLLISTQALVSVPR